ARTASVPETIRLSEIDCALRSRKTPCATAPSRVSAHDRYSHRQMSGKPRGGRDAGERFRSECPSRLQFQDATRASRAFWNLSRYAHKGATARIHGCGNQRMSVLKQCEPI